jgi:hypothetical protein
VFAADPYTDIFGEVWRPSPEGFFLGYEELEFIPILPPPSLTAFTVGPGYHDDDDDDD